MWHQHENISLSFLIKQESLLTSAHSSNGKLNRESPTASYFTGFLPTHTLAFIYYFLRTISAF